MGSSSVYDAAVRIGVKDSAIYRALARYEIKKPKKWHEYWLVQVGRLRKLGLRSIVKGAMNRRYVADLIGTEGTITCGNDRTVDSSRLKIQVGMTDSPWVEKFARIGGVGHPLKIPPKYKRLKDVYITQLGGLRALMVLKDVLPHLMGGKRKEALRAIEFFSPTGFKKGKYFASEIWDPNLYPWKDNRKARSS